MKRLLLILPVVVLLYACPYEAPLALEPAPVEPVDSSLLGYWYGIIKDGSDYFGIEALEITRKTDSLYAITRYGKAVKGDMVLPDTAYFTGFTSRINDQLFMNLESSIVLVSTNTRKSKQPEVKTQTIFYISAFAVRHDTMTVKTITDNFSPLARKGFKNSEQLKKEVQTAIEQKKNIYDDIYTLSYRKIEKPQPLKPM
ncbi:MAG TPA: hypothetical protein VF487_00325 [Chitinophagaceae bacterium]